MLSELAEEYISLDKSETGLQMKRLVAEGNQALLSELLTNRLQFGTAGLRGEIGPGYSRMNDLVVIQATQGLLAYCLKAVPGAKEMGVVIGHDHRHKSLSFAQLAAAAFISKGFKVFYYTGLVHTPMVPFGVNQLGACAGIMITASHNPKQDNGFKVYWGNGCQIIPPVDAGIAAEILQNLVPLTWDKSLVETSSLCIDPTKEMVKRYLEQLAMQRQFPDLKHSHVKVCYTPMHGVGLEFAKKAVSVFGLADFVSVPSQMNPDPEFPTVKFPNPEEKGALDKAIQCALMHNCDIIFANDPDADRFACAEFQKDTEKWTVFNGNQIGILLASFVLERYRKEGKLDHNLAVLTTAVSSHMLEELAKVENIHFDETLTGFKWLGNRAIELEAQGKTVVFAFEEAIGYMCGSAVKDKDGVSALAIFYEWVNYLYSQNKTISSHLNSLYEKYGCWVSHNSYYICSDPIKIAAIFGRIRYGNSENEKKNLEYPKTLGHFKVISVRDLTVGYDSSKADTKPTLNVSSSSQMITFRLENGCLITLRTSGTEPKIKYYVEYKGLNIADAQSELDLLAVKIVDELLEPIKNGLN